MNRRERRARKIAHEKRMREQVNVTNLVTDPHWNLFDEIHSKSKFPVKVNSIYESVFCKGEKS